METKNSFEEMMGKLSPTLRRITHKLNGHFTFFDEDDLFQEALEHLWVAFENGTLGDKTDSSPPRLRNEVTGVNVFPMVLIPAGDAGYIAIRIGVLHSNVYRHCVICFSL